MAAVLFSGSQVSLVVLPLMFFHQIQLIVCAVPRSGSPGVRATMPSRRLIGCPLHPCDGHQSSHPV
jgi:hypothetical protein